MKHRAPLRVLLLALEFPTWEQSRHVSYASQLGLEEALRHFGAKCCTLTTPWFPLAVKLCAGRKFDQVWIDIIQSSLGNEVFRNESFLEWLAERAPVRVGFLAESLQYSPEEYTVFPVLKDRCADVAKRVRFLTHVAAIDEWDVSTISQDHRIPTIWWPQAVPQRFIRTAAAESLASYAVFSGAVYGERIQWLKREDLKKVMVQQPSPEQGSSYPAHFDRLHANTRRLIESGLPLHRFALPVYLHFLRRIRWACFDRWLETLRTGCAVVNLPHFVKSYAGRVVEAMAAGQAVISWEIPNRPKNRALFEDGGDILLYPRDDPAQLAAQIERLVREPRLRARIVVNALRKVREFHTLERRAQGILHWIETGTTPRYA